MRVRDRSDVLIRSIYALCLLGAAYNHAAILIKHGLFWTYGDVPLPSAVFWTSLTLADPATALCLFLVPRLGLSLTVLIIVSDVVHNLWITERYIAAHGAPAGMTWYVPLAEQVAFMIFVGATLHIPWARASRVRRHAS